MSEPVMKILLVTERLWLREAMKQIEHHQQFIVRINGTDAGTLWARYKALADRLFAFSLPHADATVTFGTVVLPAKAVVPMLAAAGSVIAAGGSVAFVAAMAEKHGFKVTPSYSLGQDPFNFTDDMLELRMTP